MHNEIIQVAKYDHSFLKIKASKSIKSELSDHFAIFADGYRFMPNYKNKMWDGRIRFFNGRDNTLPAGLYDGLKEFATKREYIIEYNDYTKNYICPETKLDFFNDLALSSKGHKIAFRDYQLAGLRYILKNKQGILQSPTGSGKSLMLYGLIRYYMEKIDKRNKILLIVPTTSLVEQMHSDFVDYNELDPTMNIANHLHKIYSGYEKHSSAKVYVSTWQSLYRLKKDWFAGFQMVIVDECHMAKANSIQTILQNCVNAEIRIGTTGTIPVDNHAAILGLQGHIGKTFKTITTKNLIENGTLEKLKINILLLKWGDAISKPIRNATYHDEINHIFDSYKRNRFISNLAIDLKGNTLILFKQVSHGKMLASMINDKLINADNKRKIFYLAGSTKVDVREEMRFIVEKEKDAIIVGSTGVISTGTNIRNLNNIIFAAPSKSQIRVLQSIGRGLRRSDNADETVIYDIVDDYSIGAHRNYTLEHGAYRLKIYNKELFSYKIHQIKMYS